MHQSTQYDILDSNFLSDGLRCAGTLYIPKKSTNPPIIILGHGFAAERSFRLPAFADCFARNGIAAFFFDYRNFGDSEGLPRYWVSPKRHLEDWRCAINYVRSINGIDSGKIAIWGSSLGGGHVLRIASKDPSIAAVISQAPHLNGLATLALKRPKDIIKATVAGFRDLLRAAAHKEPYYSPVIGKPNDFAALNSAECWDGVHAMMPSDTKWENKVLSRVFLEIPRYNPIRKADKIKTPTLFIAALHDTVIPTDAIIKAARKMQNAKLYTMDCNHFQLYVGERFEENIQVQITFLKKHLLRVP